MGEGGDEGGVLEEDAVTDAVGDAHGFLINDASGADVLVADFGIARWANESSGLTQTNMTVGTVSYAAPEQLMGRDLDGRADQYALAATAFHPRRRVCSSHIDAR